MNQRLQNATINRPVPTVDCKSDPPLCGIVLAGGEGKRLRSFVYLLRGDLLPKQYVSFVGTRSMLTHTFQRAERLVSPERVYTVVNQQHLLFPEVRQQLSARASDTVLVQPENKQSGAGVLLSLVHLYKRYPNSTVAVFPADQFAMEDVLMKYVRLAGAIVRKQPSKLVLLGIRPEGEEPDYGYIVPRNHFNNDGWGGLEVSRLVEKPAVGEISDLLRRGALWNTMMMVFKAANFLDWVSDLMPAVSQRFQKIYDAIGTANETEIVREVYSQLEPINFSTDLLEPLIRYHPKGVVSLPLDDVMWSDWGTESRVLTILRRMGNASRLNGLPSLLREPMTLIERETETPRVAQKRIAQHVTARETVPKESDLNGVDQRSV